jgi:predicted dehydrogenase
MADELRFGLIGCGAQGRYLSDALTLTKQADFVACADVNPDAAQLASQQCGYRETYGSAEEMLAKADLDAVIVATIHDQLQPCGMAVVEAGKHLFIEKPMALNAADGRKLADAARAKGVKVMVGYTLPFLSTRRKMRQLLDEGAVGELAHVFAGQIIGGMGGWLGQPEHGGGPLLYIGTHVIYQVLDVVRRKAERVFAEVTLTEAGVDRECLFTVRFEGAAPGGEGGVVAQIATSQRLGGRYGWIDVLGSAGRVRSEWENPDVFVQSTAIPAYRQETLIRVPDESVGPKVALGDKASVTGFRYVRAWADEFADFIAAIREDRDPAVTGEDGVRVLEITDAVFESGRTGLPVEL